MSLAPLPFRRRLHPRTPSPTIFEVLRPIPLVAAILMGGCNPDSKADDAASSQQEAQAALCQQICIKPFCDPALEPSDNAEEACRITCDEQVKDASDDNCSDAYQELLECLDRLTCDEFYEWAEMQSDASCLAEEQLLTDVCPELSVRTGG